MDDLVFIFEQYDNPLFSSSLLNMAAMEDIKAVSFNRIIIKTCMVIYMKV